MTTAEDEYKKALREVAESRREIRRISRELKRELKRVKTEYAIFNRVCDLVQYRQSEPIREADNEIR